MSRGCAGARAKGPQHFLCSHIEEERGEGGNKGKKREEEEEKVGTEAGGVRRRQGEVKRTRITTVLLVSCSL